MAIVKDLDEIDFAKPIIIDTNIWAYMDDPIITLPDRLANQNTSKVRREKRFADKLTELFYEKSTPIYVTPEIINEYSNFRLRNAFKAWQLQQHLNNLSFKHDFKGTVEYNDAYDTLVGDLNNYISQSNFNILTSDDIKIKELITNLHPKTLDFTDESIVLQAKNNHFPILTGDKDYQHVPGNLVIYSNT